MSDRPRLAQSTPAVGRHSTRYYWANSDGSWSWTPIGPSKRDELLQEHNPLMRPAPDFLEFLYKMDPEYYAELTSARL